MDANSPFAQNELARTMNQDAAGTSSPQDMAAVKSGANAAASPQAQNEEFADADLARELGDLTRAANRANTMIRQHARSTRPRRDA